MRNLVLAALACGGTSDPLAFTISTTPHEPTGRPLRAHPPTVTIDDIVDPTYTFGYPDQDAAFAATHHVALVDGDTVLAALDVAGTDASACGAQDPAGGDVVAFTETICEYDSGDLRLGPPSGSLRTASGELVHCLLDGSASCAPPCTEASCGSGMRCTAIVTSHAPLYSHLGCAPAGSAALGAACAFTAGSDGDYDDCGPASACVDGRCRAQCGTACDTCTFIDGEPPELQFCD